MQEIVDRDEEIVREEWDRDEAVKFFRGIGEEYKAEIIAGIPSDEPITLVPSRRIYRPVSGSAPAVNRQARQGIQVDACFRCLLAWRFQ